MKEKKHISRYDLITPMIPCKAEILAGIDRILSNGSYILGEEVKHLESEMAAACGGADAIGVASGSAALYLALQLAGVGPGVEVITTPYTFVATIEAIIRLGGTPVFVDIDPATLNLDVTKVEAAIRPETRVILPVHIFGMPCEMTPLQEIARRNDLDIVEDMCQAFGSFYKGEPCGAFSRMGCLSFYPTKNLPGIGDGGMIICHDRKDGELMRKLRGHETVRIGGILRAGWNSRIDEIQALAIRVRLARFTDEQADRDRAAAIYNSLIPIENRLAEPDPVSGTRVTHHQYWIRVPNRAKLAECLKSENIDFGIYYDPPLHRHELMEYCRIEGDLTQVESAAAQVLALPIHQALPDDIARFIGEVVGRFLQDNRHRE